MKNMLTMKQDCLYHYVEGTRVEGPNSRMLGDTSGLCGNCTGVFGECTNITGNLDTCDITEEDRKDGVFITDLVQQDADTKRQIIMEGFWCTCSGYTGD